MDPSSVIMYEHGLGADSYTTVTLPKVSGKSCLILQTHMGHEIEPFLE